MIEFDLPKLRKVAQELPGLRDALVCILIQHPVDQGHYGLRQTRPPRGERLWRLEQDPDQHRGDVRIDSEPGRGTTVVVSVPRATA